MLDTRRQQYIRKAILRGCDEIEILRLLNKELNGIVMGTVEDESEDLILCDWAKGIGTEGE